MRMHLDRVSTFSCWILYIVSNRNQASDTHLSGRVCIDSERFHCTSIRFEDNRTLYSVRYYSIHRVNDVTESMVTIRSPFCGCNLALCVELIGIG